MRRTLALVLALTGPTAGAATDPQAVLRAIVDQQRGGSLRATLTLDVARPGRQTRYVLDLVSDGQERALIRVRAPAREAGQAFLRDGETLFLYTPTLGRALRLPPSGRSDSFLGSDLSYADLTGRDLERQYTARVTAEDAEHLTLDLTPRPDAPTPYGRVTVEARVKGPVPTRITFFDQRGGAVKRVNFDQYAPVNGRSFPVRTTVEDLVRPGRRTTLVYSNSTFGARLPGTCFEQRALETGC